MQKYVVVLLGCFVSLVMCGVCASVQAQDKDWPTFRNSARDNKSTDTNLKDEWPSGGPGMVWKADGLGEGYSSVSVVGESVFTMGSIGGTEYAISVSRSDGEFQWKTAVGKPFSDGNGNGPRGTPTVSGGKVYALGSTGGLTCCDAKTGDVVWQRNILSEFGGSNITWGISESVLLDDGNVICTPGGSRGAVVALDAMTGRTKWASRIPGNPKAAYASPVIAQVGGTKQYVVFTAAGIAGIRANDGTPMWGQNASSNDTANCATPLVIGSSVFSSSDYGTGAELVRLSSRGRATTSKLVYHTKDMKNHHGGMVHVDGFVYGSSGGILSCVNVKTGKATWREREKKGALVFADGKILFREEGGEVVWFKADPNRFQELGRLWQADRSGRPAWSHPVIVDGVLYLRDQQKLLTYNLR